MAQMKKKFIGDNQVGAAKIQLENNAYLRSRNAANSADLDIIKSNASDRIEFGSVPQSPADASAANDLVRYSQFASALDGLKPKSAVRAVSLSNINLADGVTNQSVVDGYTLQNGERVLLNGQTAPAENGIYVAVTALDATTWIRATDMDAASEFLGSYTVVAMGSLAGSLYVIVNSATPVLGVTAINFIKKADLPTVYQKELIIDLAAGDITNQYVDLPHAILGASASDNSLSMLVIGGGIQKKGVDYSVSLTGGVAGVTRITFLGALATAGASALDATDDLVFMYSHV
jgi:hypothetical protein